MTRTNLGKKGLVLLPACRLAVHLPQSRILMASSPKARGSKCAWPIAGMTIWSLLGIAWKGYLRRGKVSALDDDRHPRPPTPRGKKGHFRPVQWTTDRQGTESL